MISILLNQNVCTFKQQHHKAIVKVGLLAIHHHLPLSVLSPENALPFCL